jgi:tetratricopeptide (TPR) repeat protein
VAAPFLLFSEAANRYVVRVLRLVVIVALSVLCLARELRAHGDLHLQIVELTKEIEKDPKNAELYLRRGELHRAHSDFDAAQSDYDFAFALDPKLLTIDFAKGRMFLDANWPLSSKIALDRFLSKNPDHVEALVTRARALVKLNQRLAGVKDYTKALELTSEGRPELYLERAQALVAEGTNYLNEALKGLDEGIQKLGPLVTLELYAMDLEVEHKRYEAALARLEQVMAKSPRKETWLERRGNILRKAGRHAEARQAYESALKAMDTLPPVRRNVPAMAELEKRLKTSVAALSKN